MIIGVSGKIHSGKDEIGKIIQYLISNEGTGYTQSEQNYIDYHKNSHNSGWQIKKFADTLKDIICLLTGCTREQLEDEDFKNSKLPDEWIKTQSFFTRPKLNNDTSINCSKVVITHLSYRDLLQYIGTDLFRNQLHENVWINALMSKYKAIGSDNNGIVRVDGPEGRVTTYIPLPLWEPHMFPNWIITDCRFENEAKAIKDKGGIIIRINRSLAFAPSNGEGVRKHVENCLHPSETALDGYKFDYYIDNNGTIEELIDKVKEILIKEKII